MTGPNAAPSYEDPQQHLVELLDLVSRNFTPQEGYQLELNNLPLGSLHAPGSTPNRANSYHRQFENAVGQNLQDAANLTYRYDIVEDEVALEAVRLRLTHRQQDIRGVIADTILLQRYSGGFLQLFGRGNEPTALVDTEAVRHVPESPIKSLLAPVGLYTWDHEDTYEVAQKLGLSEHWRVREQQIIPLPPHHPDQQHQLIIVRDRSVTDASENPEQPLHSENYEITFQTISTPLSHERLVVEEVTMHVRENSQHARTCSLSEVRYQRFDHPFVSQMREISDLEATPMREPTDEDYEKFILLIERYYSD